MVKILQILRKNPDKKLCWEINCLRKFSLFNKKAVDSVLNFTLDQPLNKIAFTTNN